MRKQRKMVSAFLCVMLVVGLWIPDGLTANAEEMVVPGYHEYTETEEECIDHWYGIERGVYLKESICGIKDAGTGKVSISGTTTAHAICDTVKVGIYLDESSNGGKTFSQIGSYYFSRENVSSCHGSKTSISVKSGWHYMARGGHSVSKDSKTESTTTNTGVLTAS